MTPPEGDAEIGSLRIVRRHTQPGVHPYEEVTWETRTARVGRPGEAPKFEQIGVEVPEAWSQNATDIVAQKYFAYDLTDPRREYSVRQLIDRVVKTIGAAGLRPQAETGRPYFLSEDERETFEAELTHILVHQKAAFNSPVWFNIGVEGAAQQASACQPYHAPVSTPEGFISIGELVERNAVGERVLDAHGETTIIAVKDNGRKPVLRIHTHSGHQLDVTSDHLVWREQGRTFVPAGELVVGDQISWVRTPLRDPRPTNQQTAEAALAGWLQTDGFVGQYTNGTNRSLTLEAEMVTADEREWVLAAIGSVFPDAKPNERSAITADPNLDYRRLRWYGEPCRPFVEKWELLRRRQHRIIAPHLFSAPKEEVIAYLRSVFQADGFVSIKENGAAVAMQTSSEALAHGIQRLLGGLGIFARVLCKHDGRPDRMDGWAVVIGNHGDQELFREQVGFIDRRKVHTLNRALERRGQTANASKRLTIAGIELLGEMDVYDIQTASGEYLSNNLRVHNCFILSVEDSLESISNWQTEESRIFQRGSGAGVNLSKLRGSMEKLALGGTSSGPVTFMRGADANAGTIQSGGTTRRAAKMVALDIDHPDVEDFIWCKSREEDRIRALQAAGFEMGMGSDVGEKNLAEATAYQNANNSVRVTQEFLDAVEADGDWHLRARTTGEITKTLRARDLMHQIAEAAWRCADPGLQYDTTVNDWHTTPAQGRISASNPCAEFVSNDNTSCNLASLNLLKFLSPDGSFDVEDFQYCARLLFTAQDITISFGDFPTDLIGENTRKLRQIGTGFANLGALLMAAGLPYDSDAGRSLAGAITALLTAECYLQSTYLAERVGAFCYYRENEKEMMRVMRKHRAAARDLPEGEQSQLVRAAQTAWNAVLRRGGKVGFRNAQATVLAPTGCLDPHTLVVTDKGLVHLGKLGDVAGEKWQDLSLRVATDEGPRAATKFYVNESENIVEVVTACGYRLRGTPAHRIKVVDESGEWIWRRLGELCAADRVPLMLNNLIGQPVEVRLPVLGDYSWHTSVEHRVPTTMTTDLAEFVGYFMGDGSLHAKGLRLTVANGDDDDVLARLHELVQSLFGLTAHDSQEEGCISVYVNSVSLAAWWDACEFSKLRPHSEHHGKGWFAYIPNAVLHTNDRAIYSAFLRGLFEADGNANHGYASLATANENFAREVQTMLLALGYVTRFDIQNAKKDGQRFSNKPCFRVRILNKLTAARFVADVGFISERKNHALVSADIRQGARYDDIPLTRPTVDALAATNDNLRKNLLLQLNRKNAVSRRTATALLERASPRSPERVKLELLLGYFFDTVSSTKLCEAPEYTFDLSVPENVTYVANGFVSHNTIAFMMDCDTTGIEPDFSLIKGKSMAGGGQLLMPNRTIPMALKKLEYSTSEIDDIIAYLAEEVDKGGGYKGPRGTVSGAPHLRPEHYPVFDCAIGERAITWRGHVDMVAACQPFLSGAASKTINLPESATVEDHEAVYIYCGKIGIKAVALYRDNCKAFQPLSDAKSKDRDPDVEKALVERRTSILGDGLLRGERRQVPRKARTNSTNFDVGMTAGYIFVREFEDGRPGAIFIDVGQAGSTLAGFIKALSVTMSLGFQYGMALDVLISKLVGMQFEPGGFTADPEIRQARSLVDYIVKWLALEYLDPSVRPELGIGEELSDDVEVVAGDVSPQVEVHAETRAPESASASASADNRTGMRIVNVGKLCETCGAIMQPTGACYTCSQCGGTSGGCG